jgi:phage baseplate assembly protein gpV
MDNGGNTGLTFTPQGSKQFYWIGGTGRWDEPAHWSYTSNGSSCGCIPSVSNTVIFDKNSGLGSGKTVSAPAFSYCDSLVWKDTETNGTTFAFLEASGRRDTYPTTGNNGFGLFIGGSLLIQSNILTTGNNYEAHSIIRFTSNRITPESIQTNGCIIAAAVYFDGEGYWKLADDLTLPIDRDRHIRLEKGHLNINGKTVIATSFRSEGNQVRSLDISNSTIKLTDFGPWVCEGWVFTGSNATITATNSTIQVTNKNAGEPAASHIPDYFVGRVTDVYHSFEAMEGLVGNFSGGIFDEIRIKSAGMNFTGSFTTDNLYLLGDGDYTFSDNITVKNLLQAKGIGGTCGGYIGFISNDATTNRTINMGAGAFVNVYNALITRVNIDGSNKPYTANNSSDGDLSHPSTGWNMIASVAASTSYYWIGGTGNWSDPAHWSTVSGIASGNTCTPSMQDNVIFDGGSGLSGSKSVTLDVGAVCNNMTWQGPATDKPVFTLNSNLNIYGSLTLQTGMSTSSGPSGNIIFRSTNLNNVITSNGVNIRCPVRFNSSGGWKFLDSFNADYFVNSASGGNINLDQGYLDFNGQSVSVNSIRINATATNINSSLNMTNTMIKLSTTLSINGVITALPSFQNNSSSFVVDAASTANSTITITGNFTPKPTDVFNKVISNYPATIDPAIYHYLSITNGAANLGAIVADTLIFKPAAYNYKLRSGSTITVNEAFIPNGTPCIPIEILTTSTGVANLKVGLAAANLEPDTLLIDFARIRNITAVSDGVDWSYLMLGENSPRDNGDGQNLANWTLADYLGGGVSTGLGPDRNICTPEYLLNSARFAPTPNATFLWKKDGATVSTAPTYLATESGTYSLEVNYAAPNGTCTLLDDTKLIFEYTKGYWKGAASSDWNDPANWSATADGNGAGFIPTECTDVHILSGKTHYPDLDPGITTYSADDDGSPVAACLNVYFYPGAETARTDSLHYTGAYVEMQVNSNQWHIISPPLRDMYSGDYYFNNPNPFKDSHFVSTMLFNVNNPETQEVHTYDWSGRFSTADIRLQAGRGMAVWADDKGDSYAVHTPAVFSFPKTDTQYLYYNSEDNHTGVSGTLTRTNSRRFIYEEQDPSGINVLLAASPATVAGQPILVGNPFMAHLDMEKFLAGNTGLNTGYKIAYGVNPVNGRISDFVSYIKIGSDWYNSDATSVPLPNETKLIAPMQSFIVVPNVANPTLVADIKSTTTAATNLLRSSSVPDSKLDILAIKGEERSKAVLLYMDGASTSYDPQKDSYRLFMEDFDNPATLYPVQVYTRSSDGYALDIHSSGSLEEAIPLGIRTSQSGNITLQFSGMESFGQKIYLHDTKISRTIDLSQENEYTFSKDDGALFLDNRLYLSANPNSPTVLDAPANARIAVSGSSGGIEVLSLDGTPLSGIRITDMQGHYLVSEDHLAVTRCHYPLAKGIYIVRVVSEKGSEIKKVVVR